MFMILLINFIVAPKIINTNKVQVSDYQKILSLKQRVYVKRIKIPSRNRIPVIVISFIIIQYTCGLNLFYYLNSNKFI